MVVGVDVHKRSHAVALLDERGTSLGSLSIPNSVVGAERLLAWLDEHDARKAPVGIENAAGYGRLLCAVLESAGCEVLNVPAWRTHRDRHEQGRGKSDPGDALAIAQVVLRKRAVGPALEPELIRALALLEGLRRQSVYARTQAIQRLRAIWTQLDPEGEAQVVHCQRQRELRKLKRIELGVGIAERAATRCIRELAHEIERLNKRRPPPPRPRRQSPTQCCAAPDRPRPSSRRPTCSNLPRPQTRRRKDRPRGTPRTQAPTRQRRLPPPPRLGRNLAPSMNYLT